ncbi:MAG: hypothetical protein A2202_04275 [Bdellovibrionales bacterium RIFOXYA1_FULL_36_14]|nr:MAG: hypothetical protein A2202_04275 [Bdellovibrionales bacterium RIFOXYA1_FULL_36_14]
MYFQSIKKFLRDITAYNVWRRMFARSFIFRKSPYEILAENLDQIYFLIDQNGVIQNKDNPASLAMFKCSTYKKKYHDILPIQNDDRQLLTNWYELAFDSTRNFNDISQLAPRHIITDDKKHLKIKYRPAYSHNHKEILWIICSIVDQSALQELKNKKKEEQIYYKMIKLLLKNQEGFKNFINETPAHIDNLKVQVKRNQPNLKRIMHDAHTLKGTAASYCFASVSSAIREFENLALQYQAPNTLNAEILLSGLAKVENDFTTFVETNSDIFTYALSVTNDGKFISQQTIMNFLYTLEKTHPKSTHLHQQFMKDFVLQNISQEFSKYRSIAESIAEAQDKKIHFIVKPSNIFVYFPYYLDLYQAIIHVIRNSIDHGIETQQTREANGKTHTANITITFNQTNLSNVDYLIIEIADNGRGIKKSHLLDLARECGLSPDISEDELLQLVFKHGITTKRRESELSGKGIGLTIVKEKVEHLGGSIHFKSVENEGSTLTITLPLVTSLKNIPTPINNAA